MSNTNNEEVLLPTRDFLRQLIGQPKVKNTDLKNIIRSRGIFTGSDEKEVTGSILIKTGLSPSEYIDLRESYKNKEESPKSKTRTIAWNSETSLIEAIPENIDFNLLLNDQFGVFSISRISDFTAQKDNPNSIYMDFEIERTDSVKNWGENTVIHNGRVEIRRDDATNILNISTIHTAPETRDFNQKITSHLIKHFKDEGHIEKDAQVNVIKFSDFNNESRILFINELTQKASYSALTFIDTKDIHFSPDNTISNPPTDIAWMRDKIDDMKIKGKDLHSTFFVSDVAFHPFIQFFGVQCDYKFSIEQSTGTCRILFEFSETDESPRSELTLNLSMLKLETNDSGLSRSDLKRKLLESLEKFKLEAYEIHKVKMEKNNVE